MYRVSILTLSDKGSRGERADLSGDTIQRIMLEHGYILSERHLIADDFEQIVEHLKRMSTSCELLLTTGGTGFSPRDITPEATKAVIERETPGISEAIRGYSMRITERAMLSRACSGILGSTLIINLPGSPKAVEESLLYILPSLKHGLDILIGHDSECARTR